MMLIVALFTLLFQGTPPQSTVQLGTTVRPETTTVGQHFIATIRVRVPDGTEVRFPARPDSSASVDSAGPTTRTDSTADGFTESTMNYVLAAWDTGGQALGLDSIVIVTDGTARTATLDGFTVHVRSVLPLDTALRKPKPFRPVIAARSFNWIPWLIALIAVALVAIALFGWRGWRARRYGGLTPLQLAQREFARVEAQRLLESGEPERHAIEMVRVARNYLGAELPAVAPSSTTHEIAVALKGSAVVPRDRFLGLLDATDMIKFAAERATVERAMEIGAEARRIVAETAAALAAERLAAENATAANAQARAQVKAA